MAGIRISGCGHAPGRLVVTNHDFAHILDTSDAWIVSRTGIESRHIAFGQSLCDMAVQAAAQAIAEAGISREEIGIVMVATLAADHIIPNLATQICEKLGLRQDNMFACDLNAACCGFLYGLISASTMADPARKALVIGAEKLSRHVNWQDRSSCILFGDGAGAVILERDEDGPPFFWKTGTIPDLKKALFLERKAEGRQPDLFARIEAEQAAAPRAFPEESFQEVFEHILKPEQEREHDHTAEKEKTFDHISELKLDEAEKMQTHQTCRRDADERDSCELLQMKGREVFRFAASAMTKAVEDVLNQSGWSREEVDLIIPHQANLRIIQHAAKSLQIPIHKFFINIQEYGNTSAASIPIALSTAMHKGMLKEGMKVILAGFGGGFSYGAAGFIWRSSSHHSRSAGD